MRFPEDKIKEAILHPDLEIRDRATDYFAKLPTDSASLRFFDTASLRVGQARSPRKADRQEGGRRTQDQAPPISDASPDSASPAREEAEGREERSLPMRKREEVQEVLRAALDLIPPGLTSMR